MTWMFSLSLTTICKDVILYINHYDMNVFSVSLTAICKDAILYINHYDMNVFT